MSARLGRLVPGRTLRPLMSGHLCGSVSQVASIQRDFHDPGRKHLHRRRALGAVDRDPAFTEEFVYRSFHTEVPLGEMAIGIVMSGEDATGLELGVPGVEVLENRLVVVAGVNVDEVKRAVGNALCRLY